MLREYSLRIRRGLSLARPALSDGELWRDTDTGLLWIGTNAGNAKATLIREGLLSAIGTLSVGEFYYSTDTTTLYIGTAGGNVATAPAISAKQDGVSKVSQITSLDFTKGFTVADGGNGVASISPIIPTYKALPFDSVTNNVGNSWRESSTYNVSICYFHNAVSFVVNKFILGHASDSSSNSNCYFGVGIYSLDGNLLCSGTIQQGAFANNTPIVLTLAVPYTLPAGNYYIAVGYVSSGASTQMDVAFIGYQVQYKVLNYVQSPFVGAATNPMTSSAMPATLGALRNNGNTSFPVVVMM